MRPSDFAAHAFEWLHERISFDQGVIATSLKTDPTWLDAHFSGVSDPRALMESHAKVRHLDVLSQRMLSNVFCAHRIDVDDPAIAGPHFAPLREHLLRFEGIHVLAIAVPVGEGAVSSVFMLVRGVAGHRFEDEEVRQFETYAPHFAEAAAVNRLRWLLFDDGASNAGTLPAALLGSDGRFTQMTAGFAQLFWSEIPPISAYLPESILAEIRKGRASQLPGGKHSLYGHADDSDGWLLRIRSSGPLDRLTPRERQVAGLFARGVSHKGIAEELGLSPATARNHLRNLYEKLDIHGRDDLVALLAGP
jgi:DNA-binding CsgD family transcriptional regulator